MKRYATVLALLGVVAGWHQPCLSAALGGAAVADYPFEGTLADIGGNGYNGVGTPAPVYVASPRGRAADFDGSDRVDFTTLPNGVFAGDFSVSWFARIPQAGGTLAMDNRSSCSATDYLDLETYTDAGVPTGVQLTLRSINGTAVARSVAIERNRWVHLVAVREGNVARVHADGAPGVAVTVPAAFTGASGGPFGIGEGNCDEDYYLGQIDDLRIYNRALSANEIAELGRNAMFTVAQSEATRSLPFRVKAAGLIAGSAYRLDFVNSVNSAARAVLLDTTAAGASAVWTVALPTANFRDGRLELSMLRGSPPVAVPEHSVPFQLLDGLDVEVRTAVPQAGREIVVDVVKGLGPGQLYLRYGGRIVVGPIAIDEQPPEGDGLTFIAPEDIPATFPGQVSVVAELRVGGRVTRIGGRTITVAAPYSGPFVQIDGIDVTDPLPRPGEAVGIDGQVSLPDGRTQLGDLTISAYWVGQDLRITPLSTAGLALAPDGSFRLDTFPPSLGAMSAFIPSGPGRIRLVTRRPGQYGREFDYQISEGPLLQPAIDLDPQTDVTIRVRRNIGGGQSVPIEGAYVIVDGNAPVVPVQAPPSGGDDAGWVFNGSTLDGGAQPQLQYSGDPRDAEHQASESLSQFRPPLVCGTSLYRRYTDASGEAEFGIAGGPAEPPDSWQDVGMMQRVGSGCADDGCRISQDLPRTFTLSVYTLHRGAGYIDSGGLGRVEDPSRYRIEYVPATATFTIRNLRTGEEFVQTGSANIQLTVPTIAGDNYVAINDPIMFQQVGNTLSPIERSGNDFGQWIEFTGNVSQFENTAPVKVLQFGHIPDVNGPITSARLYLPNLANGQPALIGNFSPITQQAGCSIQDDGSMAGYETWELRLDPALNNSWRFPRGIFYPNDAVQRRTCGYIEATNFSGGLGRRNLCFEWQEAPAYFNQAAGNLIVEDSDMRRVLVRVEGVELGDSGNQTPEPGPFFGEDVARPEATSSSSNAAAGLFDTITASGPGAAVRNFNGNNPEQFNEPATGASEVVNFDPGQATVEIGVDAFQPIFDTTIPLFKWYWGVPEILSAEVYADLRLFASYYYYGTLTEVDDEEQLDLVSDALFAAEILIGVDIDVLFGFIVDAGASIVGRIQSEIPIVVADSVPQPVVPCITFRLDFYGYVDPCAFCPTPVIEFDGNIINAQDPPDCAFYDNRPYGSDFDFARSAGGDIEFGAGEARALRRHPALAYDAIGNGQALTLAPDGRLQAFGFDAGGVVELETLTIAPGARQAKLAYYQPDRAIAVWLESALDAGEFASSSYQVIGSNQRIAWATWDGETWGTRQFLTAPGNGEGHPTLVACADGDPDCPPGGEVFLAWQRNTSGNVLQPRHRIWHATWRPGFSWTAPVETDSPAGQVVVNDITPQAFYVAGEPFVVWARQLFGDLNAFELRRLAYRHVGVGPAHVVDTPELPDALVAPSVVAGPGGSDPEVLLTFLRPDDGNGPIGTNLALHIASAQCIIGLCDWTWHRARDPRGRAVYGERPLYTRGGNYSSIVMRAFRYEGVDGEPVQVGDTIGAVLSSGDLVRITPNYAVGQVQVTPITADGAMHFGHAAAYDPGSDAIVTLAATYAPAGLAPVRSYLDAAGIEGTIAHGTPLALAGAGTNLELRALPAVPDLLLASLETASAQVSPGAGVSVLVKVANRGTPYVVARDGAATLELRFDSPLAVPVASVALGDLADGAEVEVPMAFTAPASAHADEAHTLYASLRMAPDLADLDAGNDSAEFAYPGLPVPTALASITRPGAPAVQLGWQAPDDPRVAGHRVYLRTEGGSYLPLGASPNRGFLDLTAQFAVPRTYAVSSYSARGIESPLGAPITVMPVQPERDSIDIFRDGFEDATP